MAGRTGVELRIVRSAATLGFFGTVIMTIIALQDGETAWGWAFGVLVFGIAMVIFWWDELLAQGNAREDSKAANINQTQGVPVFPTQVQAQQVPPPNPALPPGPGSPIQRSG